MKNYFIVKHDLRSLQVFPGRVWNSEDWRDLPPRGFGTIKQGDRWIAFAYTTSENREKSVSQVTGFYECRREARRGLLTRKAADAARTDRAWVIEGRSHGVELNAPVVVPPIQTFITKPLFHRKTITRISKKEYEAIRAYVLRHRFDPKKINGLKREPVNEQEVLAATAAHADELGIQQFIKVQTRFPDVLVKIRGTSKPVYLELELYSSSFLNHNHRQHVRARCYRHDKIPVGVLCWVDDANARELGPLVHRVFSLRDLLRERRSIRW